MTTAEALRGSTLAQLEQLYREAPVRAVTPGRYRGEVLQRVDSRFARSATAALVVLPFERLRFGLDFEANAWFFGHPRARLGRFRLEPGRSRWRETQTLRLLYDVSRLPVRGLLYDEVKPLGDALCLGLGGLNLGGTRGCLFFFLLEALGRAPQRPR